MEESASYYFVWNNTSNLSAPTILFITHQLPKGLMVDEAILLGKENAEMCKRTAKSQANGGNQEKVET